MTHAVEEKAKLKTGSSISVEGREVNPVTNLGMFTIWGTLSPTSGAGLIEVHENTNAINLLDLGFPKNSVVLGVSMSIIGGFEHLAAYDLIFARRSDDTTVIIDINIKQPTDGSVAQIKPVVIAVHVTYAGAIGSRLIP